MKWRVLGSSLVVAILLIYTSAYTVTQGQRAILFRFGEIQQSNIKPGLHFKWPVLETIRKYDARLLTFNSQPENILTQGKKNVTVRYFVKWRITDFDQYHRTTHGDEQNVQANLSQTVNDGLRNELGKLTLQEAIAGDRKAIMAALTAKANGAAKHLGIQVQNVRIVSIDLSSGVESAVYKRMKAEQERVAIDLRAQGKMAAESVRAKADRERSIILAKAYRKAQTLRGQGDAKAAAIYAQAYNKNPDFYAFYRSLEAYRQSFNSKNNVLVLEPNSQFFRFFNQPQSTGKR